MEITSALLDAGVEETLATLGVLGTLETGGSLEELGSMGTLESIDDTSLGTEDSSTAKVFLNSKMLNIPTIKMIVINLRMLFINSSES